MKPIEQWNLNDFDVFLNTANIDFGNLIKVAQQENQKEYVPILSGLMTHIFNAQQDLEIIINKYTQKGIPRRVVLSHPAYVGEFKDSGKIDALRHWLLQAAKIKGQSEQLDNIVSLMRQKYSTNEGSSAFPEVFGKPIGKGMPLKETMPVIAASIEEGIMKEQKPSDKYLHIANIVDSPELERKKVTSSGVTMKESVSDSLFDALSKEKFSKKDTIENCADYGFLND